MRPRNRVGGGLVTPDDRLEVLPVPPAATSRPMGWSDLRAEHFRDTPDFELDLPGGSHHLLALYLRPPEETGLRTEGVDWEGTPASAPSSCSPPRIPGGPSGAGPRRA